MLAELRAAEPLLFRENVKNSLMQVLSAATPIRRLHSRGTMEYPDAGTPCLPVRIQ